MSQPTYTISPDGSAITCHMCGLTSHNLNDVAERFCGYCKQNWAEAEVAAITWLKAPSQPARGKTKRLRRA